MNYRGFFKCFLLHLFKTKKGQKKFCCVFFGYLKTRHNAALFQILIYFTAEVCDATTVEKLTKAGPQIKMPQVIYGILMEVYELLIFFTFFCPGIF